MKGDGGLEYVVGCWNLGNTCFMNSLLQAIASCELFVKYLNDLMDNYQVRPVVGLIVNALRELRKSDQQNTLNLSTLHYEVRNTSKVLDGFAEQQDALDMLFFFIDELEKCHEFIEKVQRSKTFLDIMMEKETSTKFRFDRIVQKNQLRTAPFRGSFASQMLCKTCASSTPWKVAPYSVISLSLVDPNSATLDTLEKLFTSFTNIEEIEDVECRGLCKAKRTMYRRTCLAKMPSTLCIHLNRRLFHPYTGRIIKLHHHVKFSPVMDFSRFAFHQNTMEGSLLHKIPALGVPVPKASAQPKPLREPQDLSRIAEANAKAFRSRIYELRGVVIHHGGPEGGHFTAMRCVGLNTWYHISDHHITPVSMETVLASQAYMLFYEKRAVNTPVVPPTVP